MGFPKGWRVNRVRYWARFSVSMLSAIMKLAIYGIIFVSS